MAKFKVKAKVVSYCFLEVEASNSDEAISIAEATDGGDFITIDNEGYFEIIEAKEE